MRDKQSANNAGEAGQTLAVLALLYASGSLTEADAAAFERRLAEDQAACEALVLAVPLAQAQRHQTASSPNPAYRAHVRRRLTQPRFRGHPALWAGLGAAAAALVIIGIGTSSHPPGHRSSPGPDSSPAAHPVNREADPASVVADVWAELHNPDHLLKTHEEEMRRRGRAEERGHGLKMDQRHYRPLGNSSLKN
jgi:hypothetical protein